MTRPEDQGAPPASELAATLASYRTGADIAEDDAMVRAKIELAAARDGRVQAFRDAVQVGLDELDSGRYMAVAIEDLPSFVDGLGPRLSRDPDEGMACG